MREGKVASLGLPLQLLGSQEDLVLEHALPYALLAVDSPYPPTRQLLPREVLLKRYPSGIEREWSPLGQNRVVSKKLDVVLPQLSAYPLGHGLEDQLVGLPVQQLLHHALGNVEEGSDPLYTQPDSLLVLGKVRFSVAKVVDKFAEKPLEFSKIELLGLGPRHRGHLQDHPGQGGRRPEHGRGGGGGEAVEEEREARRGPGRGL